MEQGYNVAEPGQYFKLCRGEEQKKGNLKFVAGRKVFQI